MNGNRPGIPEDPAKSSQTKLVVWILLGVAVVIAALLALGVCAGVLFYYLKESPARSPEIMVNEEIAPMDETPVAAPAEKP